MFKGTDKVRACLSPTLTLHPIEYDGERNIIYVVTAQSKTKLALVYDGSGYTLRKFNIRGRIAGRVLNNWELIGDIPCPNQVT